MNSSNFVERNGRENIKEIDKGIRNKFQWQWMDEKDEEGDFLCDFIRKLKEPGMAWCLTCKTKINYGSSGKKSLIGHTKNNNHSKARKVLKNTQSLPALMTATKTMIDCTVPSQPKPLPYGASPSITTFFRPSNGVGDVNRDTFQTSECENKIPVSLADRKSHLEGLLCTFIAENDLPLSSAPKLLDLAKEMAKDPKALNSISMERSSASYKLVYGVNVVFKKRLLQQMRENKFTLNIDESTTKANNKKIMNVLVCFFSEELGESVTELYCALEMTIVNADTVYEAIKGQLITDGIPFENLIGMLTDSAAYMRGCHHGFQVKMKNDAPHIVDIDGDTCHHIHNIVKHFSSELDPEHFLSSFLDDIFNDGKFSPDIREDLNNIAEALGLPQLNPLERASHRWLSLLTTTERMLAIYPQLKVLYYSFLSKADQELYHMNSILKGVSMENRKKMMAAMRRARSKSLTAAGKARKARIANKIFHRENHLLALSHVICTVIPKFRAFVLSFELKQPMVHKLHDRMVDTFKCFLANFVKVEYIKETKMQSMDIDRAKIHLPITDITTGSKAAAVLSKMDSSDRNLFLSVLKSAYIKTAQYMQKKLPISNALLERLSALDPEIRKHSVLVSALKNLKNYFPTVEIDSDLFNEEVNKYHLDTDLPTYCQGMRLDHWWNQVMPKYPALAPIIKACLSIFTGPRVEQSFSMMNHIITSKTNRLNTKTYEAYLSIKYHLLARQKTAIQLFCRKDIELDPIDRAMAYHIQTARQHITLSKPIGTKRPAVESLEGAPAPKRQ